MEFRDTVPPRPREFAAEPGARRIEPALVGWEAKFLLVLCVISFLFWIVHSFAVRAFITSIVRLLNKFIL